MLDYENATRHFYHRYQDKFGQQSNKFSRNIFLAQMLWYHSTTDELPRVVCCQRTSKSNPRTRIYPGFCPKQIILQIQTEPSELSFSMIVFKKNKRWSDVWLAHSFSDNGFRCCEKKLEVWYGTLPYCVAFSRGGSVWYCTLAGTNSKDDYNENTQGVLKISLEKSAFCVF